MMTITRICDWCGGSLAHRKATATTCSDDCRITVSKWRRGIGPFAPDGPGHDHTGRHTPANHAVARERADRDRKRRARAVGPIRSDRRVQFDNAVDACVAAMRQVGSVSPGDAEIIAIHELTRRMPKRRRRAA